MSVTTETRANMEPLTVTEARELYPRLMASAKRYLPETPETVEDVWAAMVKAAIDWCPWCGEEGRE